MLLPLLLALATPATPTLWTDWREAGRQSAEAEAAQLKARPEGAAKTEAEARALGERVGQLVAAGDCAEGERVARQAGDMGLARAVRRFCYD